MSTTPPSPPTTPSQPAWTSRRAWLLLLLVATIGLAADLWTKAWAFDHVAGYRVTVDRAAVLAIAQTDPRAIGRLIPNHPPLTVIPRLLDLTLVLNPGAVFGMGAGRRVFFMVFTLATVGFALFMFARWTLARDRFAHAAIGLLVAGGLGNFYDRWCFACVRDFIHPLPGVRFPFGWQPFGSGGQVWPWVSNVADAFLIVGILILAWQFWRQGRASQQPTDTSCPPQLTSSGPSGSSNPTIPPLP